MKNLRLAAIVVLGALFAPMVQAQVRHVEMRLEGMT